MFESKVPTEYPIFAMADLPMDEKIRDLQDQIIDLNERAQTIQATADAENRPLSEDEEKEIDSALAQSEKIEEDIARRQAIAAQTAKLSQGVGRQTEPQAPDAQNRADDDPPQPQPPARVANRTPRQPVPRVNFLQDRGKWGWQNMGEFAMAVRQAAARNGSVPDPRLVHNAPTTYSQEGIGSDGGFAVPPDFRTEIWQKVTGEDSLMSMTDMVPTSKNTIVLPADETTPWDSSGGIQAYWKGEAAQLTQSKAALEERTISLHKLTALVPVTEELLEDAPGLDGYLRKKVGEKFDFKLNLGIIQGTGAGQPLGMLNAPSLVSVAKETGQPADTVVAENINKMWARLYAPCRRNAVWLINQDIEPQLESMVIAAGLGGVPVYMPPGGLADTPYARLKGRPVIPTQACETLGDKGDILLVDLKQYQMAYKTGGVRADVSMHLWFDYDVLAYRFILRIAGQPYWNTYITPRDGSNYLSWAISLDERA